MAQRNKEKLLQTLFIDGEQKTVPQGSLIKDIVPPEVKSVQTIEGQLIPKEKFSETIAPSAISTNISDISKG